MPKSYDRDLITERQALFLAEAAANDELCGLTDAHLGDEEFELSEFD